MNLGIMVTAAISAGTLGLVILVVTILLYVFKDKIVDSLNGTVVTNADNTTSITGATLSSDATAKINELFGYIELFLTILGLGLMIAGFTLAIFFIRQMA